MSVQSLKWRMPLIAAVVAISLYYAIPPFDPDGSGPKEGKIKLGLDLQGGMHLILRVDTSNLSEKAKEDAPLRAMEIIRELEPWPRGVYSGALGLFGAHGEVELGLPIRTATVRGDQLSYHAGGGIVADSDPDRELAETWLKTAALRRALGEHTAEHQQCSSG